MKSGVQGFMQERQEDFEDRIVLDFLQSLGYTEIEPQPTFGSGKADYLVHFARQSFYVEAHSPDLSKGNIFDYQTEVNYWRFVELFERKFSAVLPQSVPKLFSGS